MQDPEQLAEAVRGAGPQPVVVIDEVQKLPGLLDEVHWLIENTDARFVLCGSSARGVKHGRANLLGGRALRHELLGLVAGELGASLDLDRLLNHGYLPSIYLEDDYLPLLDAYVGDYLKEEIFSEGLVRNLPAFSNFLSLAAFSDADTVQFANIASDCGVAANTIKGYFEILVDTLQGRWLPSYRRRPKRRVVAAPKFYFADVGVVNHLARRGQVVQGTSDYGKAFENWIFHELVAYNSYRKRRAELTYWRLASGAAEVDFIINDFEVALEVKSGDHIRGDDLKGLRSLLQDQPTAKQLIVVCQEARTRVTSDGIKIMPYRSFVKALWQGELF
jgi:predicted AAA+ superfamily ATPase